jgi:hypothetical protein
MSRYALHREAKLDCADYVVAAICDVRACIELAPSCGPLLVAAYRALSVLGELRETIDAMPTIECGERPI